MRCHYVSDLHLESQDFQLPLPEGDILIVAGDLCHARALDPARTDRYSAAQRERTLRFADRALTNFAHVLFVPGNHEHYDGVCDDTVALLRARLPGFTVLDGDAREIGGVRFIGATLWSDLEGGDPACMARVRRRMGEYFFVKKRTYNPQGATALAKLQPADTLAMHRAAWTSLSAALAASSKPAVVITHHAPSFKGCNPRHAGNGLDGAYASRLDDAIASLSVIAAWVHGHTHICRRYAIGSVPVYANCRGFDGKDQSASRFTATAHFDL